MFHFDPPPKPPTAITGRKRCLVWTIKSQRWQRKLTQITPNETGLAIPPMWVLTLASGIERWLEGQS